ncbi:MAG: DUF1330 domain-containing protein [Pseudomonadota bacterium]
MPAAARTAKRSRGLGRSLAVAVGVACILACTWASAEEQATACDEPVLMLVIGQLESRDALKEYGVALRKLNTYPEQQGYYEFSTRPSETFEGQWPDNQFIIGANFPCVEAARGFWFSDDYQSIRHLRSGAGKISVTIHPVNEVPEYIGKAAPKRLLPPQPTQSPP